MRTAPALILLALTAGLASPALATEIRVGVEQPDADCGL